MRSHSRSSPTIPTCPTTSLAFHAQQALEKLLKAALAHAGVAPPRIHDLGELIARLADADLSPPASASEARALVPWAAEFRYEDILDDRLDRATARRAVADLREWVDGLLDAPADPEAYGAQAAGNQPPAA